MGIAPRSLTILAAVMFVLAAVTPVAGHILEPWSTSESIGVRVGYSWHRSGDTIETWSSASWNSTRASNLRHDASEGDYRFTMNADDISGNLNANGQSSTTYRNPYYDKDDDDANLKYEEAEITAQDPTFPSSNHSYQANFRFSHSYFAFGEWRYDADGGTIQFDESLSQQLWWTGDLWDTTYCCASWDNQTSYPARSAGAVLTATTSGAGSLHTDARPATNAPGDFAVNQTSDRGEALLVPNLARGLGAYRNETHSMGRELAESGPARGIITFDQPVGSAVLDRLARSGVHIESIEAVSELDARGDRWTFFSGNQPDAWDYFASAARDENVSLLGIVSLEATFGDEGSLEAAMDDDAVFLVDLSIEQYLRLHPGAKDVVMNDVFWNHAGWLRGTD
jgi:hypothetical protein